MGLSLVRTDAADGSVEIDGSRCGGCALVAFPPERYGCERCGALAAHHEPLNLAATGAVIASATVHRHHHPTPATPFVVVEVALDAGPVLKALFAGSAPPSLGTRVAGVVAGDRFVFAAEEG